MWIHNLNPILLHLGPLEIRWYGLVYALGFLAAGLWLAYADKKGIIELGKDKNWDLVMYVVIGGILGARLFEIFWEPSYYLSNPLNILKIWQGGMSFHGGLLGGLIGIYFFSKKEKINFWKIADVISVPAILFFGLGRIANFINGELVGTIWSGKGCVVFPGEEECRHPSTLYAAGKRILIFFGVAWIYLNKKFKPGFLTWNVIFWDGLGRIIVDFYREDILYFGFKLGQWFSLVMVLAAGYAFWKYYQKDWKNMFSKN